MSADIPVGMVAWAGGDAAPADWDGGPVSFRGHPLSSCAAGEVGDIKIYNGARWTHEPEHRKYIDRAYDVIAYVPRTPAQPADHFAGAGNMIQPDDRAALRDPNAVHINMLRGAIAKPSIAQIIHLYGADALSATLSQEPGK